MNSDINLYCFLIDTVDIYLRNFTNKLINIGAKVEYDFHIKHVNIHVCEHQWRDMKWTLPGN